MKYLKNLISILLISTSLLFITNIAFAVTYDIKVYRDNGTFLTTGGSGNLATTGITYMVLDAGDIDYEPIYDVTAITTAKTNPVTSTVFAVDDKISFYSASATVDIIITDEVGGYSTFLSSASASTVSVTIDERPGIMHHGIMWWDASCTAANTKEVIEMDDTTFYDTGVDFSAGTLIDRVDVRVITCEYFSASGLISVGIGANTYGLLHGHMIEGAGYTKARYWSDTSSIGFLMLDKGSDGAEFTTQPYYVQTTAALTYGFTSADDTEEGENTVAGGYLHYFFTPLMPIP